MERAFIVSESCELFQEQRNYEANLENQRKFVNRFCEANGIESKKYRMTGDGFVNAPFKEEHKGRIKLGIVPTESDKRKFEGQLRVGDGHDVSYFKKSSRIAKAFAEEAVRERVVVNIWKPMLRDHFKCLGYARYSSRCFENNGKLYVSIDSEQMDKDEMPEGFEEIKMSELYRVIEEIEARVGE